MPDHTPTTAPKPEDAFLTTAASQQASVLDQELGKRLRFTAISISLAKHPADANSSNWSVTEDDVKQGYEKMVCASIVRFPIVAIVLSACASIAIGMGIYFINHQEIKAASVTFLLGVVLSVLAFLLNSGVAVRKNKE